MKPRSQSSVIVHDSQGRPTYPRVKTFNRAPSECQWCGQLLAPGDGRVWWCNPSNAVCSDPSHQMEGGPHISCDGRCDSELYPSLIQKKVKEKLRELNDVFKVLFLMKSVRRYRASLDTKSTLPENPSSAPSEPVPRTSTPLEIESPETPLAAQETHIHETFGSTRIKCHAILVKLETGQRPKECSSLMVAFKAGAGTMIYQCGSCRAIADVRSCCGLRETCEPPNYSPANTCPSCGRERLPKRNIYDEYEMDVCLRDVLLNPTDQEMIEHEHAIEAEKAS